MTGINHSNRKVGDNYSFGNGLERISYSLAPAPRNRDGTLELYMTPPRPFVADVVLSRHHMFHGNAYTEEGNYDVEQTARAWQDKILKEVGLSETKTDKEFIIRDRDGQRDDKLFILRYFIDRPADLVKFQRWANNAMVTSDRGRA